MARKRVREINRFDAQDEKGRRVPLIAFQEFVEAGTLEEADWLPGIKFLRTDGGLTVNREAQGRYKVVQTGTVLTSSDPEAP